MLTTLTRSSRARLMAAALGLTLFAPTGGLEAKPKPAKVVSGAKPARAAMQATSAIARPVIAATGFAAAIGAARRGDEAAAMSAAQELSDPVARALVEWQLIRGGTIDRDYARIASFARGHAHWPSMTTVRRRSEAALLNADAAPETVLAFFNGNPPASAEGRLALANAYLARGDRARAAEIARAVWQKDELSETRERDAAASFGDLLRAEDHRARYTNLMFAGEATSGMRAAERLGGSDLALARAWAATAKRDKNAPALLDAVPADFKRHPGFLFSLLQHLRREERYQEALVVLAKSPRETRALGDADKWWEERRIIARQMVDEGDYVSAYRAASEHAAESQSERAEAEFMAGWIALRFLKRADLAEGHFNKLAAGVSTPISLSRAHFWLGRTAEARGAADQARARYTQAARYGATFYGQLALNKIGQTRLQLPPAPQASAAERQQFGNADLVRAARLLAAAGQEELALTFVSALGDHFTTPGTLALLGDLANEIGDTRHVIMVGKKATQKGQPLEAYAFPTSSLPAFDPVGRDIDRALVYAITRQESVFDPRAQSPVGARGLMQLMPGTAKMVAKQKGLDYTSPARLTADPTYNLQLGSAFLADLIDKYDGSYIMAFAAYNAGPGRVNQWVAKYGDPRGQVDPLDWIERIPFTETRNYVQRVMENVHVYRARLNSGMPLESDRDLRRGAPRT